MWATGIRFAFVLSITCGLLTASSNAQERVRVFGDRLWHPEAPSEFVRSFVDMPKDHDGDTVPLAVGAQFTPGFIRAADSLPITWNLSITLGAPKPINVPLAGLDLELEPFTYNQSAYESPSLNLPAVGRNPFPFMALTYNHLGHIPVGVYDYEHFDVRFFMETQEWWWGEQYPPSSHGGPCREGTSDAMYRANMPVPLECWPGNPRVVANGGHYVWGQGAHIYNAEEPAFQEWAKGSSLGYVDSVTFGEQAGRIAYIEGMFSRNRALQEGLDSCVDISHLVPKHFTTERLFPTRKCLVQGPATIKIVFDQFVTVPGGCDDLRNGTMTGYFIKEIVGSLYPPECEYPVRPASGGH